MLEKVFLDYKSCRLNVFIREVNLKIIKILMMFKLFLK